MDCGNCEDYQFHRGAGCEACKDAEERRMVETVIGKGCSDCKAETCAACHEYADEYGIRL